MTSREFKTRLAAGDKLAIVMHALYETGMPLEFRKRPPTRLARLPLYIRNDFATKAAHILAALASAEARANAKALEGFSEEDVKEMCAITGCKLASAGVKK